MNIKLICVGKLKEEYLRKACAEYGKRMTPYAQFTILEVDEYRLPSNPKPAQIEAGLIHEGKLILDKISRSAAVTALCVEGKALSSPQLSRLIFSMAGNGYSHLTFVIGGSFGLSEEVKEKSNLRLSLSNMTFPHTLARVLVCEQIYRAFQIEQNTPYHK